MQEHKDIPKEHRSELDLIEKCRKNPHEFSALYNKYYRPIYLFLHKRTNDSETTADLTSQVFLKAMSSLPKYTYQGFPFSTWLYKIALNEANEHFRKKKSRQMFCIEDSCMEKLQLAVNENPDNSEEERILINSLKRLEPEEMQILELRFFEEKSFSEIGFILNITEGNAKVKTYRVIDRLRKILFPTRR